MNEGKMKERVQGTSIKNKWKRDREVEKKVMEENDDWKNEKERMKKWMEKETDREWIMKIVTENVIEDWLIAGKGTCIIPL